MRTLWTTLVRVLGAFLALLSCIPMVAMLPTGFVAVLGFIGLTATPIVSWATPLAPVAPALLILSVLMLTAGHSRCGWQPAGVVLIGGLLVYLAMYVVVVPVAMPMEAASTPIPATIETMPGMNAQAPQNPMSGVAQTTPTDTTSTTMPGMTGRTNAPLFYVGLLLIVSSFGLVWWRRRRKLCRPFIPVAVFKAGQN